MPYRKDLLKFAPADYDVKKIGFIILDDQSNDSMDIDYELTPTPAESPKIDDHVCHICKNIYASQANLKRHLKTVHVKQEFKCDVCHAVLNNQRGLSYHKKTHSKQTKEQQKLSCDICGRVESSKESLDMHLDMHLSLNIDIDDIFD